MERRKTKSIGQILIENGFLSENQLRMAIKLQKEMYTDLRLGEVLVNAGFVEEEHINMALADQFLFPHIELKHYKLDKDLLDTVPSDLIWEKRVVPIMKLDRILSLALVDPLDKETIEEVARRTNCTVRPMVVSTREFKEYVEDVYKSQEETKEEQENETEPEAEVQNEEESTE